MYKAKLINNKGEVTILQFVSVGPNNVASAVVAYADGEIDCLPLHELRVDLSPALLVKSGKKLNAGASA